MPRSYPTSTKRIVRRGKKRNIDKQLIGINELHTTIADHPQILYTCTFPCTLVSMRWSIIASATAVNTTFLWNICIVRQNVVGGPVTLTLPVSNNPGVTYSAPETDVIAFGISDAIVIAAKTASMPLQDSTKTQRKLQAGDQVVWVSHQLAANQISCAGVFQFFIKT